MEAFATAMVSSDIDYVYNYINQILPKMLKPKIHQIEKRKFIILPTKIVFNIRHFSYEFEEKTFENKKCRPFYCTLNSENSTSYKYKYDNVIIYGHSASYHIPVNIYHTFRFWKRCKLKISSGFLMENYGKTIVYLYESDETQCWNCYYNSKDSIICDKCHDAIHDFQKINKVIVFRLGKIVNILYPIGENLTDIIMNIVKIPKITEIYLAPVVFS